MIAASDNPPSRAGRDQLVNSLSELFCGHDDLLCKYIIHRWLVTDPTPSGLCHVLPWDLATGGIVIFLAGHEVEYDQAGDNGCQYGQERSCRFEHGTEQLIASSTANTGLILRCETRQPHLPKGNQSQ
jgi:hypothetical protein